MKKGIFLFLFFILFYHILHTFIVYGQGWISVGIFSLTKELFFLLLVSFFALQNSSQFKQYLITYKNLLIVIVLIFGIFLGVSRWNATPLDSVVVGIKYDLWWIVILVGGILLSAKRRVQNDELYIHITTLLWITLIGGIVRQTGKVLLPEIFTQWGYGAIGDYSLGSHPPMWYRTGPGGMMRFSGIFSGPNNLGYFLVGFFPVVLMKCLERSKIAKITDGSNIYDVVLLLLMIFGVMVTMSRAAIGAMFLQLMLLIFFYRPQCRSYLYGLCMLGIIATLGLLSFKRGSTLEHLSRFLEGLQVVLDNPGGLGLGIAGPSIHYHGIYLPENQYLQRAIDGGVLGLGAILCFLSFILYRSFQQKSQCPLQFQLSLGFTGLLAIGMLLHSFEDSMVNYIFFILFGMSIGSCQAKEVDLNGKQIGK